MVSAILSAVSPPLPYFSTAAAIMSLVSFSSRDDCAKGGLGPVAPVWDEPVA